MLINTDADEHEPLLLKPNIESPEPKPKNGLIKNYPKSFFDKQRWHEEESVMKWIVRLFGRDFFMSWIIRGGVSLAPKIVYLLRTGKYF